MYLNKSEFDAEIVTYQTSGEMSSALAAMLYLLAEKLYRKMRPQLDPDDFKQECVLQFMAVVGKLDTTQNAFSYLTATFGNVAYQMLHEAAVQAKAVKAALAKAKAARAAVLQADRMPPDRPARPSVVPARGERVPRDVSPRRESKPGGGRPARLIVYQGTEYTATELAAVLGCSVRSVRERLLKYGWDADRAFAEMEVRPPGRKPKRVVYQGTEYTAAELAGVLGMTVCRVQQRLLRHGWDADQAFGPRADRKPRERKPRRCKRVVYQGKEYTAKELAGVLGLSIWTVRGRLYTHGWDNADQAFTTNVMSGPPRS